MKTNVSAILTYVACPTLWYGGYHAHRGTPETKAMRFGNRWHSICEHDRMSYDPADTPLESLRLRLGRWQLKRLEQEWGWRYIAREKTLSCALGAHELFGQLDAIVMWNGRYWHLQHKTLAESRNLDAFLRVQSRSYHEQAYRLMGLAAGFHPWGGSFLSVLRKVAKKRILRGPIVTVHPLRVIASKRFLIDMERRIDAMDGLLALLPGDEKGAIRLLDRQGVPQEPSSCDGYAHNSICPFIDVCDGLFSAETLPRRDPLARYTKDSA